jgi:outer membrane protein OmpU
MEKKRGKKMKNILLTTAALVMTAGVASAEVTFSGNGGAGVSNSGTDTEVWSGIDFNFSGSVTTDSGMTLSVGEDIGGGHLVDWGDKEVDTLGTTPGTPTITITSGSTSITLENQAIDDLYDDDQNGDIGFSTTLAGASIGLTVDTAATGTQAIVAGAGCTTAAVTGATQVCTTDAVAAAAANPSFSYSISLPMAGFTVTAIGTDANDAGDAANKISAAYVMGDTTLTLSTDDSGAAASVNKLAVATMMGGASVTVSADDADDWDLSVGYTEGAISVSVSTDEVSAWETDVSVDLGGGAAFKVSGDSNDFVAAGVTFSF